MATKRRKTKASYKSIAIPCEVSIRDYLPRLIIATEAANAGYTVYLGARHRLEQIAVAIAPTVFLSRAASAIDYATLFPSLKSVGTKIAIHDVEASIALDNPLAFSTTRLGRDTSSYVDLHLCWSAQESNITKRFLGKTDAEVAVVGNPLFEINSYFNTAALCKRDLPAEVRQHRYTLVNLSAGLHDTMSAEQRDRQNLHFLKMLQTNGYQKKDLDTIAAHDSRRKTDNRELIDVMRSVASILKNRTFVIRPHPGENLREFVKHEYFPNNCSVIRSGPVFPWITSAKQIIHTNCTSALESVACGKVPIHYRCRDSNETLLFQEISKTAQTEEEIINLLQHKDSSAEIAKKQDLMRTKLGLPPHTKSAATIVTAINKLIDLPSTPCSAHVSENRSSPPLKRMFEAFLWHTHKRHGSIFSKAATLRHLSMMGEKGDRISCEPFDKGIVRLSRRYS